MSLPTPPLLVSPHPLRGLVAPGPVALQWSHSQQTLVTTCATARFWASEVAPMGWRPGAPALAAEARRCKHLTTLPMELGKSLHVQAALRAQSYRAGAEPLPLAQVRQQIAAQLNHVWTSRRRRADFVRDPKRVPFLLQTYYGRAIGPEQIARVKEQLERGVVTLHALGVWGEVAAAHPDDVLVVDSLTAYELPDPSGGPAVRVWAAPDLVFRSDAGDPWSVVDFKSGRIGDRRALDRAKRQVESYAVFLRHYARVLGPDDDCRGRVVALGDGGEHEFWVRASDIDEAEARIRAEAAAMAALWATADRAATEALERAAAAGQAPAGQARELLVLGARRSAYPSTRDTTQCGRCGYFGLCCPELVGRAADVAEVG